MPSGLAPGDIHQLSEQHQYILLLLGQAAAIVSMLLLYRSSPTATKKPAPEESAVGKPQQPSP